MKNRAKHARKRAGLNRAQVCVVLCINETMLYDIETNDATCRTYARTLADTYGVNIDWLMGHTPQHDYAALKKITGHEELSFHDQDVIAEFLAALPRVR